MNGDMLVSAKQLQQLQLTEKCLIVDCRFSLMDPAAGYQHYLKSHIPQAVYANLERDLSSPVTAVSGRHPLPEAAQFAAFLSRCGWQQDMKLIAYDDMGGAFAARLWWLMKYFGQSGAALLDGGLAAWVSAGYATSSGDSDMQVMPEPAVPLQVQPEMVLSASEVKVGLANHEILLVDARAADRYRGDVEPLDKVAGHIPGARNLPFGQNMASEGYFKSAEQIRRNWQDLQGKVSAGNLVHMCGSGVTACFNQFAAELAGIHGSKLYAGSWSEWIRDSSREVESSQPDQS
jgi:thiosulfate/3-mercaptopyruvate sulfurtransferase